MVRGTGADSVAAGAATCPVEKDVATIGSWLTPTHMPPDGGEGESKVAGSCTPGALERRAHVHTRPTDAAVSRAVHDVLPGGQAAAAFVHRRYVNAATALQVTRNLDVANEAGVELHLRPSGAVVGVDDVECAAIDSEIVVGNVHPPVEW